MENRRHLIGLVYAHLEKTISNDRWPLVPNLAGSNPADAVGFLWVNKNPQHVGGHGYLSVVIVVCCQVEVSATNSSRGVLPTVVRRCV